MVGAAGLEPATLGLEGRCSIHLSYAPECGSPSILMHSGRYFPGKGSQPREAKSVSVNQRSRPSQAIPETTTSLFSLVDQ